MIAHRTPILVDQNVAHAADPVFALIEEHRAAYAAWAPLALAVNSLPLTDPTYAAAEEAEQGPGEREHTALAALMTATPSTLAGIAALAEYLPSAIRRTSTHSEETEGERALRTIAAALATLVPAVPAPSPAEPDPIFGAIAAYRAAWQAVEAASESEAADIAGIAMSAAYRHLRTTRPTTPAGYTALADHLAWHIEREPEFDNTVGEHVAAMLIAGRGALCHVPLPAGSPEPDPVFAAIEASRRAEADMAAFGKADEEMTPERRAVEDALCTAQLETRETAWKTVPTTREGRAALVEYARFQIQAFTNSSGHIDSPESLIADILDAISAAIEAERPEPIAPCASAPPAAAGAPTLSAMSIGELADLYDVSLRASEQLAALACLPGCTGEDRARVGIILDLEADRFGDIAMDCAEELKSRLPATDEERADRVSILAKHAARFHAWSDLAALATAEASASAGGRR